MVFVPIAGEQRREFFKQSYAAHLPGYTGHCPTLKFRVGKRFGASTEEIMKELLEKKILKTGPYRPCSGRNAPENASIPYEKQTRRDWKNEAHLLKAPPYILGYTGYIPGFNSRYGLSFMRAVEEGAREWRENQSKLKACKDTMKARLYETDSFNLLSRTKTENTANEIGHDSIKSRSTAFHYQISPERLPIVGYTGHIPGTKGEVALSKGYAQAAKRGLELVRKEREGRLCELRNTDDVQTVLDVTRFDAAGYTRS